MMMNMEELNSVFTSIISILSSLLFLSSMFERFCPFTIDFEHLFTKYILNSYRPYVYIKFFEYIGIHEESERSKAFVSIERYLEDMSTTGAGYVRGDGVTEDMSSMLLSLDNQCEIYDEFKGIKLTWSCHTTERQGKNQDVNRYYILKFHRRDRALVTECYLKHVLAEAKEIATKMRVKKLYTNLAGEQWVGNTRTSWSSVIFEHPATFNTLAMEVSKKQEIIDDLVTFSKAKDYYERIGKTWKRGYLLYGPPGTGKSTMIAAMSNLLDYNIYDIELTSVYNNTELRKLLIQTTSKSIIVIEDIDCSLNLTGKRNKQGIEVSQESKLVKTVTLSGLLNFIDGLWSAVGSERIIVFTTNHIENLDPALIRSGRMDRHILLSYCCFETFKVLAKNYLNIEEHDLFGTIACLLGETEMTPADVAENLMPKNLKDEPEKCLGNLIRALEKSKEKKRLEAENEEEKKRLEAEKEEKEYEENMGKEIEGKQEEIEEENLIPI